MKTLIAQMTTVVHNRQGERNMRSLGRFFLILAAMVTVYSVLFHVLMLREGQDHTWLTGFYWTLTVMSTLGFGDITFHTDLGRLFSIVVLLSGTIFLLVLLPFTFIEFFYLPWIKAQEVARAPRQLPERMKGHVLLTQFDALTEYLISRLEQYHYQYALMVSELDEALRLHDLGLNVMLGDIGDPDSWVRARASEAALVVSTGNAVTNTNVVFTLREISKDLQIMATAQDDASADILELVGSNVVLRLEEMIGQSFARRIVGSDAMAHVIGEFDDLLIAEAGARGTPIVGKQLRESRLRENFGVTVVGIWERGTFEAARPDTEIHDNTILLLAGDKDSFFRYDEFFCIYNVSVAPVLILGGGRVGRATARALDQREVDYRVVELLPERVRDEEKYIVGNASRLSVLEKAGIHETSTVIITTRDDELNVYLTIFCRRLRPKIQLMSRATQERTVGALHRAGADSVLSYTSMGTNAVMNLLQHHKILMVAEGLYLFSLPLPTELHWSTIANCAVREKTGCSVVALQRNEHIEVVSDPGAILEPGTGIVLVGTAEAQEKFLQSFSNQGG